MALCHTNRNLVKINQLINNKVVQILKYHNIIGNTQNFRILAHQGVKEKWITNNKGVKLHNAWYFPNNISRKNENISNIRPWNLTVKSSNEI